MCASLFRNSELFVCAMRDTFYKKKLVVRGNQIEVIEESITNLNRIIMYF